VKAMLVVWAILAVAHVALARVLVGGSVVSSMLSAGVHTPAHFVGLAALFYMLRLAVVIVMPAALVGLLSHAFIKMGWRGVAGLRSAMHAPGPS